MPKYYGQEWLRRLFLSGHSGVEFFFVLSGIVIFHAHAKDLGHPNKFGRYLWKRFRRIYPLYWLVLLVEALIFLTHPQLGTGVERSLSTLVQSFFLVHVTSLDTVVLVSWTLFHEILFYLVFGLAILSAPAGWFAIVIWMCTAVLTLVWPVSNPVLGMYLSPLNVMFAFGMLVIAIVRSASEKKAWVQRYAWSLALAGSLGFIGVAVTETILAKELIPLDVVYGVFAAVALLGWMLIEKRGRLPVPRWLLFFGDASYAIYLIHHTVLSFGAKIMFPLASRFHLPMVAVFICMSVLAVSVGAAVHLFIERRFLLPKRSPQRA